MVTKEIYNGQSASWIMMFDLNGQTAWAFAGSSINNTGGVNEGSAYVSCEYGAN